MKFCVQGHGGQLKDGKNYDYDNISILSEAIFK